jgi:Fe(3+) dicitrate transport protein
MMRSKVFSLLLCCLCSQFTWAQYQLRGRVLATDSSALENTSVVLSQAYAATTGPDGSFLFTGLPAGKFELLVKHPGFAPYRKDITIPADAELLIILTTKSRVLQEVVITDNPGGPAQTRMRGVENLGISEGKKSEVIVLDQVTANLATNNARQVYSRVAGLNIWENDGAGLQLSIGGRGLDPNRTSNFNVRQNGYDISADALGYPESYYTPPLEAVEKIQVVRGAASLQYGTQFGGLLNFVMKKPDETRKIAVVARPSIGSFGFYNAFTSAGGKVGKMSYYSFIQYKKGNGWRSNSEFDNYTAFANINYDLTEKTRLGIDVTHTNYLSRQPGGLTDEMFRSNARQTNRERNWFNVNWNMLALHFDHKISTGSEINIRTFGLLANRYSLGFRPNRVATVDDNSERDLIKGDFTNWGVEGRYLRRYSVLKKASVLLLGARYYHGFNHSRQGLGSNGNDANFNFVDPDRFITYDYRFPNRNVAFFAEHIFYLTGKFSVTPGIRYEYINTRANGFYGSVTRDLAGNIISITRKNEERINRRNFVLAGIGLSYKPSDRFDLYGNVSQNYRSITFSDMRISNPSSVIDPDLKDEKGYSADLGIRSNRTSVLTFDISLFYLNYNNRIGEVQFYDEQNRILRLRSNVGEAIINGLETYIEADLVKAARKPAGPFTATGFINLALIHSYYKRSKITGVEGKKVEFVPAQNLKTGLRLGYRNLKASFQYTYLSRQYADATNTTEGGVSSVVGVIPAYGIMDASISYLMGRFKLEGSINNLTDARYFTRRATGYPGPGILPSDGRSFYLTLEIRL